MTIITRECKQSEGNFQFKQSQQVHTNQKECLDAAILVLGQGETLLRSLKPEIYTCRVPEVFNASIGGHYRHSLEHFICLLGGLKSGLVNYDQRQRDTCIEKHLDFAMAVTRQIRSRMASLAHEDLTHPVKVCCAVAETPDASEPTVSSLGRELVYCITHAIHHYALISVIGRLLGFQTPKQFGIAPSTLAYQAQTKSNS